jgi:hypothetical protein
MHLRLLRLFLGFAAFAWGISVAGVFAFSAGGAADKIIRAFSTAAAGA